MRRIASWTWRRKVRIALTLLALFALLNLLAYRHAYSMTHFVRRASSNAAGTPEPEHLGLMQKAGVLLGGVTLYRTEDRATPADLGLICETHTLTGETGALKAWYVPRADARGLVVMFHGYGSCMSELLPELKGFHDLGYSCFLIDFPGSGGSDGDATTIGYREAGDVARTLEYARAQWPGQRLILFGQSMGAAAVLRAMAVHGVKADAAVLECPFDTLLHTVEARFAAMGVPAFPGAELLIFWGGLQHGFNGFAHNPVDYARSATGPILMLHGAQDRRVSRPQLESIYANLPCEKELHVFEGLGHESYTAKRPEEWKECVSEFLGKTEKK
jgi:uncharacterized protein